MATTGKAIEGGHYHTRPIGYAELRRLGLHSGSEELETSGYAIARWEGDTEVVVDWCADLWAAEQLAAELETD